jgi:hypothetical protein
VTHDVLTSPVNGNEIDDIPNPIHSPRVLGNQSKRVLFNQLPSPSTPKLGHIPHIPTFQKRLSDRPTLRKRSRRVIKRDEVTTTSGEQLASAEGIAGGEGARGILEDGTDGRVRFDGGGSTDDGGALKGVAGGELDLLEVGAHDIGSPHGEPSVGGAVGIVAGKGTEEHWMGC